MYYQELDLVSDCGQLWSDEDLFGVHLDAGLVSHQ